MTTRHKWIGIIILGIWLIFVMIMGAGRAPRIVHATPQPTATAQVVEQPVVDSPAVAAAETPATATDAAVAATPTAIAPAGDAIADVPAVAANAPVTSTVPVTSTAADLPPAVDLPPVSSVADKRVAQGAEIFLHTAGGVGCQLCHGLDARGLVGPSIVGKTADNIRAQFQTNAQMQFIILSDKEIEAVGTYLQFLADPTAFELIPGGGEASGDGGSGGATVAAPTLSDPVALQGEQIYKVTAGGVGCQLCHGENAAGGLAPAIAGATADDIKAQFARSTQEQFITLTDQEFDAVASYLQYLANPSGRVAASAAAPTVMDPVVAQGEQIYNVTAGGVGCGLCHGANAAGGLAPAIVGATVEDIRAQFARSTQEQFITLTDQEFDAVATYLQYLANPTAGTAASTETGTGNGPSLTDPQVATGERVFQFTAGGVGCQLCHGKDATGLIGPNIVGKTADDIRTQFEVNAQMQFIILTDAEIDAVATYLQYLATQP